MGRLGGGRCSIRLHRLVREVGRLGSRCCCSFNLAPITTHAGAGGCQAMCDHYKSDQNTLIYLLPRQNTQFNEYECPAYKPLFISWNMKMIVGGFGSIRRRCVVVGWVVAAGV